jgi:hypothetical protein
MQGTHREVWAVRTNDRAGYEDETVREITKASAHRE